MRDFNLYKFYSPNYPASVSTLLLLLLLLFLHSIKPSMGSLILPLKIQQIPSMSIPTPPNRLSFRHNVTLTVSLTVGTPPQTVTMVIDTGSELSWLRCNKSLNTGPFFDPFRSVSYKPIPCTSSTCTTRTRDLTLPVSCDSKKLCHATLAYTDASYTEGNLAYETFRMGHVSQMVFGCMSTGFSSDPEEDGKSTGLMGMNRGSLSFVSQMRFPKFAYCIGKRDSTGVLLFGETSFAWLKPLSYTPLVQMSTPLPYYDRVAYTVKLEGIRVGQKVLPLPKSVFVPDHTGAGQTMVDSGTQFTFLLGPVYTALRNEFLNQTKLVMKVLEEPNFVFQGAMDLCYLVPKTRTTLPMLPTVSLMFPGAEMAVSGDPLLYPVPGEIRGNDRVHCFTFGDSERLGSEAYLIGHHHQQNMWVEYDIKNSRMGFGPVQCDLASQKLGIRT